MNGFDFEKMRY